MDSDTPQILLVDDDPDICSFVRDYLTGEGYRVSVAGNAAAMREAIARAPTNLVLLDIGLPDADGMVLARSLRAQRPELGIIMLTGRGDTIDRIVGLELGADDYLAKPFHLRELLARVKSVSRRKVRVSAAASATANSIVQFAGWRLNLLTRDLRSPAGAPIKLTRGEFDLLKVFVANPNHLLSRERLFDLTRGHESRPLDRAIDVQVGRLRRKLSDDPQSPRLIKTMRNGGYMFAAAVETGAAAQRGFAELRLTA